MKTNIITFSTATILLFSCGNNSTVESETKNETSKIEKHIHSENQIELNNGNKWKVKDDMLIHIRNMEKDVNSFAISDQKDYKYLTDNLQKNINLLTSNCTMTGKAHDELHKWLLPFIDLVSDFSNSKNEILEVKQFEKMKTSFSFFNQFFE